MLPLRLAAHHLDHPRLTTPAALVAHFGAIQAQDYPGALWAIGQRLPATTRTAVETALATQTFYRTWAMRGTLHFVAADDIHWLMALVGPRALAADARRYQQLELDPPTLHRAVDVITTALAAGPRTRSQLLADLEQGGIPVTGQRGYYLLSHVSQRGLIAQTTSPTRNDSTFVLLPAAPPPLPEDIARTELARRYIHSHGPVTLDDFVWWSGLRVPDARATFADLRPHLHEEQINGLTTFRDPALSPAPATPASVHLLPPFDEYLVAYRQRDSILNPAHIDYIVPGRNGVFRPIVVQHGRIIGTWQRTEKRNQSTLTFTPLPGAPTPTPAELAPALERFAHFLDHPVTT